MKYICIKKGDTSCYGIGNSIEEALIDYLDSDEISFEQMDWYQLSPVSITMSVQPFKQTATKVKK